MEISVGAVHPDQTVAVVSIPHLLAEIGGQHEIRWRAYTPSARRAAEGTLTLVVPPAVDAPALGRLRGVLAYPDLPLIDESSTVTHSVRITDPPLQPPIPTDDTDLFASVRHTHAVTMWEALGLDPTTDEVVRDAA
jgi:hypothetical protein